MAPGGQLEGTSGLSLSLGGNPDTDKPWEAAVRNYYRGKWAPLICCGVGMAEILLKEHWSRRNTGLNIWNISHWRRTDGEVAKGPVAQIEGKKARGADSLFSRAPVITLFFSYPGKLQLASHNPWESKINADIKHCDILCYSETEE